MKAKHMQGNVFSLAKSLIMISLSSYFLLTPLYRLEIWHKYIFGELYEIGMLFSIPISIYLIIRGVYILYCFTHGFIPSITDGDYNMSPLHILRTWGTSPSRGRNNIGKSILYLNSKLSTMDNDSALKELGRFGTIGINGGGKNINRSITYLNSQLGSQSNEGGQILIKKLFSK